MNHTLPYAVALLATSSISAANTTAVISTETLCVLAGLGDSRSGPSRLRLHGTDLGITYERDGKLEILFGDTWPDDKGPDPNALRDDAFGTIDLAAFPDGDAAKAHCKRTGALPITFDRDTDTAFATLDPGFAMDGLKTPLAAFAGRDREFAVFVTGKPIACATRSDCGAFICDVGLGYLGKPPDDFGPGLTLPCIDGAPGCTNETRTDPRATGFCRDPRSSIATSDETGRRSSVVLRHKVGVRSMQHRARYATQDWPTSRFVNHTITTVDDFAPLQSLNDEAARKHVLIWGRPWWNSVNADGRTLQLYFAYAHVPSVDAEDRFDWRPHYFTGIDATGRPTFSTDATLAAPLDLSGGKGSATERYDIVAQMSVRFIAALDRWVMFYGGGTQLSEEICSVPGANCDRVNLAGAAIRMRTAAAPWGPWSEPIDVLVGGDPRTGAREQYASGGLLHHPSCVGERCAPFTPPLSANETGTLYGANLIEQWTEQRPDGAIDLYWNVSTWNPYRVMLMKTRVRSR